MESPDGKLRKSMLVWQIVSEHVALFGNDCAMKDSSGVRWYRERISDDCN